MSRLLGMFWAFWVIGLSASALAQDSQFSLEDYRLYSGDYNGDGLEDVRLFAVPKIVMVHSVVDVPVVKSRPALGSFTLFQQPNGNYSLAAGGSSAAGEQPSSNHQLLLGDFNGDGLSDVLLHAADATDKSVVILAQADGPASLVQHLDATNLNYDISQSNGTQISVNDVNGDGYDDITIQPADGNAVTLHASASGSFTPINIAVQANIQRLVAGAIAGEGSVSSDGSFQYSIPLTVSPGTAGMQPSLTLSYNSNGGNGHLGLGWMLSGLSLVTRCAPTLAQDGRSGSVSLYDNTFCIDGQRLVAIQGVAGQPGTEYRVENDDYTRIISHGSYYGAPSHFIAYKKTGEMVEFGHSSDSRVHAPGKPVHTWAVNKITDSSGNYMLYQYAQVNDEQRLANIHYTGNAITGLAPYARVEFSYIGRSDGELNYISGTKSRTNSLISHIRSYYGNQQLREYTLSYRYSSSSERAYLSSLTECATGGECVVSTQLKWRHSPVSYRYRTEGITTICGDNDASCDANTNRNTFLYGDINGDGKQDMCYRADNGINCYLGPDLQQHHHLAVCANNSNQLCDDYLSIRLMDVDVDGKDDLVLYDQAASTPVGSAYPGSGVYVYEFNAPGVNGFGQASHFSTACHQSRSTYFDEGCRVQSLRFPDLNGDARPDMCFLQVHNASGPVRRDLQCAYNTGHGWGEAFSALPDLCNYSIQVVETRECIESLRFVDTNADGRSELMARARNAVGQDRRAMRYSYDLATHQFSPGVEQHQLFDAVWDNAHFPDLNADGLVDICALTNAGVECYFNDGLGNWVDKLTSPVCSLGYASDSLDSGCNGIDNYQTLQYVDVNGDGDSELVFRSDQGLNIFHYYAGELRHLVRTTVCRDGSSDCNDQENYRYISFADFNGDGYPEPIYRGDNGMHIYYSRVQIMDKMYRVANGMGAYTNVTYRPLTDGYPLYEFTAPVPSYPLVPGHQGQWVVSELDSTHSAGGTNENRYRYRSLYNHVTGYGRLGFRSFEEWDMATDNHTFSQYNISAQPGHNGLLVQQYLALAPHYRVRDTTNTWSVEEPYPGVYQPRIMRTDVTNREIGMAWTDFTSKEVVENQYDTYGNPTYIKNMTLGEGGSFITETFNSYSNNPSSWQLGRLLHARVVHSAPGVPTITRESSFAYNAQGNMIQEVLQPGHPLSLTTSYQLNAYGQRVATTQSWGAAGQGGLNFSSRTNHTIYDAKSRFVMAEINTLGQRNEQYWDESRGLLLSSKDINGLSSLRRYDGFGREVLAQSADGGKRYTDYLRCATVNHCPSGAAYFVRVRADGAPESTTYFGRLGQEVRSSTVGLDGRLIYTDVQYNHRGEVVKQSDPYYVGDPIAWITREYDVAGRVTKVTDSDGSVTTTQYNGLETIITNPNGQVQREYRNAAGWLVRTIDNAGTSVNRRYDAVGDLLLGYAGNDAARGLAISYDAFGNRVQVIDPDKGTVSYQYNALGLPYQTINAAGERQQVTYDALGRTLERHELGVVTRWRYDTAPNGIGLLAEVSDSQDYRQSYQYDTLSRPIRTTTEIDGSQYVNESGYDHLSRPITQRYPSGLTTISHYDGNGFLTQVSNSATGLAYWQALATDARGNVIQSRLGNGVTETVQRNIYTDRVESIQTSNLFGSQLQGLNFSYDAIGNLLNRQDAANGYSEHFSYDELNRLRTVNNSRFGVKHHSYDAYGNLLSKDGHSYLYGAHSNRLLGRIVNGQQELYQYDAKGNMLSGLGRTLEYNFIDKPTLITKGDNQITFSYGPERSRFKRIDHEAGQVTTTHYVGGYEKRFKPNADVEEKHYLSGFALVTRMNGGEDTTQYFHRDHLGSLTLITDQFGEVVERLSFDAWGKRRQADSQDLAPSLFAAFKPVNTTRGFGGHEHLDPVGLVHMNGRVYDPELGRFLSADPFIQAPNYSQSFNRYAYVLNNPLSYTDPSGYFFKAIKKAVKSVFRGIRKAFKGIAKAIRTSLRSIGEVINQVPYLSTVIQIATCATGQIYACAAVSSALTYAQTGDLKAAFFAGTTAFIFNGVGDALEFFNVTSLGIKITAHAVTGGVLSVAQGGNFKSGFLANGFGKAFGGGGLFGGGTFSQGLQAAVVGGVGAELGGGNFKQGAINAALAHLYNELRLAAQKGQEESNQSIVTEEQSNTPLQCLATCTAEQLGAQTLVGGSLTVAGSSILSKPFQMGNASKGTSFASKFLSQTFPQRLEKQIPTPRIGHLRSATPVVGRALGRFVPVVGQAVLLYDGVSIGVCTASCINDSGNSE